MSNIIRERLIEGLQGFARRLREGDGTNVTIIERDGDIYIDDDDPGYYGVDKCIDELRDFIGIGLWANKQEASNE